MSVSHQQFLPDENATLALAKTWASTLQAPLTVYLEGDLGAGKTTFTRGLLNGLGHKGTVKSPTYAIVESYDLPAFSLHHFDLYRFTTPEEWEDAGLDELINHQSVRLIEWPQQGAGYVPSPDISITLSNQASGRHCHIAAHTPQGQKSLEAWLTNN